MPSSFRGDVTGKVTQAKAVANVLDQILARPEHAWYLEQRAKSPAAGEANRPSARSN